MTLLSHASDGVAESLLAVTHQSATADRLGAIAKR
jgi:hypothetical protein